MLAMQDCGTSTVLITGVGVNSRALLNQSQIIASETEPWADALSRKDLFLAYRVPYVVN
jgi:hypothetical protein